MTLTSETRLPIPESVIQNWMQCYEENSELRTTNPDLDWRLILDIPVPLQKVRKKQGTGISLRSKAPGGTNKYPFQQKEPSDIFNWNGYSFTFDEESIARYLFANASPQAQPEYIATAGAPGSGKSTLLDLRTAGINGVYIDPDRYTMSAMTAYRFYLLSAGMVAEHGTEDANQRAYNVDAGLLMRCR